MHVRDVGANGDMDGHRYSIPIRGNKHAVIRKFWRQNAAGEILPGGFAITHANALGEASDFVNTGARFLGHAKLAFANARFDIFRSVADHGDFKIMYERGAIHGDARDKTFAHQVDEHWTKSDFDDVATHAPQNGLLLSFRAVHGG